MTAQSATTVKECALRPCGPAVLVVLYNIRFHMPQFIYTMKGLGKVHPPETRVLDDIWLSFYFGAKIGVLGLNGAGKSSLLKIMSGEDQTFIGEAFAGEGATIGFLHQEPPLDPNKTVL